MRKLASYLFAVAAFHCSVVLSAQEFSKRIPVVTQVQGAVFYRTSLTIGNDSSTKSAAITLILTYRSPVDSSVQTKSVAVNGVLAPHEVFFLPDVIEEFRGAGSIRSEDANVGLYGTLLVRYTGLSSEHDLSVVARTYSPATGGGTNGIAYAGRPNDEASSSKIHAAARNGDFGIEGSTRTNIAFVNEGGSTVDLQVTYYDGSTGATIKTFLLSDVIHHLLSPGEVVQLNNIFATSGVPAGTSRMVVQATLPSQGDLMSGYVVQLDSITNDGSFFVMTED